MPPEISVFCLQLLLHCWEDFYIAKYAEKRTFPRFTLRVLTELLPQSLEAPRTQGQCITLPQRNSVRFCFSKLLVQCIQQY